MTPMKSERAGTGRGVGPQSGASTLEGILAGAVAGAVATWVMGKVTSYLYSHEPKQARDEENSARGGSTAYATAAEKGARLVGTTLSKDQKKEYGQVIHWSLGLGAAALYGAVRNEVPVQNGLARGLAFGTAFWLLMDETVTPVLGLTPGPTAFPWQTHARGLVGHLVFGATTEGVLQLLG